MFIITNKNIIQIIIIICMSCHFNCDNKNYVYLTYLVLHRNILNQEFLGNILHWLQSNY